MRTIEETKEEIKRLKSLKQYEEAYGVINGAFADLRDDHFYLSTQSYLYSEKNIVLEHMNNSSEEDLAIEYLHNYFSSDLFGIIFRVDSGYVFDLQNKALLLKFEHNPELAARFKKPSDLERTIAELKSIFENGKDFSGRKIKKYLNTYTKGKISNEKAGRSYGEMVLNFIDAYMKERIEIGHCAVATALVNEFVHSYMKRIVS
jgi:hypothetical protein